MLTNAHRAVTILGICAIFMLGVILVQPSVAHQIRAQLTFIHDAASETTLAMALPDDEISAQALSNSAIPQLVVSTSNIETTSLSDEKSLAESIRQQQLVTYWISKRYHVAGDAANMFVKTAYSTAKEVKLDPLLILAVMAIESRFNPFAESSVGAQGLMQVMSKLHHEKFQDFGGIKAALNPAANIKVGSQILKEYVMRSGSVESALKIYVGAAEDETDSGYGEKVLDEYRRLKEVATGKRVPIFTASASPQKLPAVVERKSDTPAETAPAPTSQQPETPVLKSDQVAML